MFQVKQQLYEAGFMCDVDVDSGDTMNKKIRNAQLAQYNFILGNKIEYSHEPNIKQNLVTYLKLGFIHKT